MRPLLALVTLAALPAVVQAQRPTDSTAALPAGYTLLSVHGDMRVLRYEGIPGRLAEMHQHPPHVAYIAHGGTLRCKYPSGTSIDAPLRTGQVLELARPLTHSVEPLGPDTVVVIIVEYGTSAAKSDSTRRIPLPQLNELHLR
jgi:hypothetical protein